MPRKARFHADEIGQVRFVRSGSGGAITEGLGAKDVQCVNCGATIADVFVTDVGPLGGDCLATITGDDSTRKALAKVRKAAAGFDRSGLPWTVRTHEQRPWETVIYRRHHSDYYGRIREFVVAVVRAPEQVVRDVLASCDVRLC